MLSRRQAIVSALGAPVAASVASQLATPAPAATKMVLSIHQNTSSAAGFQKTLEGWAKAGIKNVELTDNSLEGFLKTGSLADAKKLIGDLGLTPVSAAAVLPDVWIPGPARAASLETWKKRCEQFATLGLNKIYCPSITNRKVTPDDYKATPEAIREAGDIAKQFNLNSMIEFARTSTHISTLSTSLKMIREANHPNVRPMLDFFHFWSGLSKFEDLDMLKPGELLHCHFQDTADDIKELYDNNSRLIPGDGVAPVVKIIQKLSEKNYSGALSVELFLRRLTQGDPEMVAAEIKQKCDAVMKKAGVL